MQKLWLAVLMLLATPLAAEEWRVVGDEQFAPYSFVSQDDDTPRGLDVELAIMQVLHEGFKDPKYRPAPLLVEMVEAGRLGRKTGQGFFSYV